MKLYYCDHHGFPLPAGHKFPIAKYALLRGLLAADAVFEIEPAPFAGVESIERVHDPDYVRAFLQGAVDPRIMRRIGFPWSEGLVRRTLASLGGTLAATAEAMRTGCGGNLAGGTHHAFRAEGAGFCVFNDLAVAVRACGRRAAVVDLDVHQGDGTAAIFERDPAVLTVSMHGENNFPFHKQRSKIDIGLADGTGNDDYLGQLAGALTKVREFRPEILFYQSGVDGLEADRLGRLRLTMAGLQQRDRMVLETSRAMGIPVVITLGGGYAEPIDLTAEAHANTFRTAADVFEGVQPDVAYRRLKK